MATNTKTMEAVTFASIGAPATISKDLPIPSPTDGQILVKSLYTAINPVDNFMSSSGMLVQSFPLTLGCDASGVVVESKSRKFKSGDKVFGCTRLGTSGYGTAATYHLFDADVAILKPENVDDAQAATLGVGTETALLGIVHGLHVGLDEVKAGVESKPHHKDEWVVVLGGASSVGKYAVQILVIAGYRVVASCSKSSSALVESLGAKTFDYKASIDEQVKQIREMTGGKVRRVFDAVASADPVLAKELFGGKHDLVEHGSKHFTTTNDWSGIEDFAGAKTYPIRLGEVGRPEAKDLNGQIQAFVPIIHELVANGKLKPSEYELVGKGGLESAVEAFQFQQSGKGGNKKVVVKIGET